jgi:hypothetical protein
MNLFRVICIAHFDLNSVPEWAKKKRLVKPAIGDLCTVVEVATKLHGTFYTLAEFPDYMEYNAQGFAILPEPDADEMREEVREAIVNIETALV